MDSLASILIVDSDPGFASMLSQALEQVGPYRTVVAESAGEAMSALATTRFDLAVVDLGLVHPDGVTVARRLRSEQPGIRLMVIPLMGEDLPSELDGLGVQGVLPKPFFFPELGPRFEDALLQPLNPLQTAAEPVTEEAVPEPAAVLDADQAGVLEEMDGLSRDLGAEALLLTRGSDLVAHVGRISAEEAGRLVQAVEDSRHISVRVAQSIGREVSHFEQCLEGGAYIFYALAITEELVLSAILPVDVPLGLVRHRARRAAERLRQLMSREELYVRD